MHYLYIVYDRMDSCIWAVFWARAGLFQRSEAKGLSRQALDGVACLQALNIDHGDLSFKNMLVRRTASAGGGSQFELKITDYGSCFTKLDGVKLTSAPACTEHCRAPELFLKCAPQELTAAIDIWAMGALLGSVACGAMLFSGFEGILACLGPLTKVWPDGCRLAGFKVMQH